jgi:acyl carrier protein
MATEPIDRKVREIVALQLGLGEEDVQPDSTFVDDLGADSLDVIELLMALEEEFEVDIPDQDAEEFEKVADVIEYLQKKVQ